MMNQKTLTYAVVSSLTLGTLCFAGHAAAAGESVSGGQLPAGSGDKGLCVMGPGV
ncbi:hypothetical protein ACTNDZ_04435 [Selenomonas montiformis]|uniref:hypothetical protein n=2 Tax=Selenomonas montiformis TaxID=2652285 RepID=UPI003F8999FA